MATTYFVKGVNAGNEFKFDFDNKAARDKAVKGLKKIEGIEISQIGDEAPMVTRINLMSGKPFEEREDTPGFMSPASESYWSM